MKRKHWTAEDVAWLDCNLGEGNVILSKIMKRSIPSIESKKRNLRNGKNVSDPVLKATVMHTEVPYHAWKRNTEHFKEIYFNHVPVVWRTIAPPKPRAEVRFEPEYTEPTCIGDREKELGINNGDEVSKALKGASLVVVAIIILIIIIMTI